MDQPSRLTRAAWAVVGLLWAVALLNYLDRQLLVNVPGPVKAELGIADARFGLFTSVFLWIYGLCSPVAGYLADRVGRRPVIIASLLVWSAATLYTGLVNSFTDMLIARALLGVSEAFYMPAAVALIVDLLVTLGGEFAMPHGSADAARAAAEITRGRYRLHFWVGSIGLGHALPLALIATGTTLAGALAGMFSLVGLYLYEYAFVMAPQEIPNS